MTTTMNTNMNVKKFKIGRSGEILYIVFINHSVDDINDKNVFVNHFVNDFVTGGGGAS